MPSPSARRLPLSPPRPTTASPTSVGCRLSDVDTLCPRALSPTLRCRRRLTHAAPRPPHDAPPWIPTHAAPSCSGRNGTCAAPRVGGTGGAPPPRPACRCFLWPASRRADPQNGFASPHRSSSCRPRALPYPARGGTAGVAPPQPRLRRSARHQASAKHFAHQMFDGMSNRTGKLDDACSFQSQIKLSLRLHP